MYRFMARWRHVMRRGSKSAYVDGASGTGVWGADALIRDSMREQIDNCPHRDDTQLYTSCDTYCPTLAQLFSPYPLEAR